MGNGVGSLATEMRHRNETTGKLDGDYCYTDFGKIGEGFGMKAFYAKTPDEFRKAVQDAQLPKPCRYSPYRRGPCAYIS